MNTAPNPYQSPSLLSIVQDPNSRPINRLAMILWPVVFALNLPVAIVFGLQLTGSNSRFGMACAIYLMLAIGWGVCAMRPMMSRTLIFGSILTALSQFLPALHIIIGIFAVSVARSMGLFRDGQDMQLGQIPDVFGGFLVTFIVGTGLMFSSLLLGTVLDSIFPKSWLTSAKIREES